MEKLNIDLLSGHTEAMYIKARNKYIANYTEYNAGGLFSIGYYKNVPAVGEAKWNEQYPDGFESWKSKQEYLTAIGEQMLIDKINEIVDFINKQVKPQPQVESDKHE